MLPPVLRFERMPAVMNRPQRAMNGREYRIERIAMPHCWAVEIDVDDGKLYHLIVEEKRGTRQAPVRTTPRGARREPEPPKWATAPILSRELENDRGRLRRCGISREDAFVELGRAAIASGGLVPPS